MSLEQLDQLAEKVSQAMFLIQKLRAEKNALEIKTAEQASQIEGLEMDVLTRDEEIASLKSTLADRENQIQDQGTRIDDASERLQRMLSALSGLEGSEPAPAAVAPAAAESDLSFVADENPQQALF